MATPDFSKVWASSSPLPAYTFSDADYITGWDFVGSAPPTKNEFDAWFNLVDTKLNYLYSQLQDTASKLYPVGSVYISFNSANPSTLFGGTWTRLKDTFLLANGDTYGANTTGGSATKTISVANLPAHNHSASTVANHTHTVTAASAGSHTHTATTSSNGSHTHYSIDGLTTASFDRQTSGANTPFTDIYYGDDGRYGGNNKYKDAITSSAGAHTHTLTTQTAGSHKHTMTCEEAGEHTHTIGNTGSGTPINIMPPYTTVYMWQRTA